MATDRFQTAIIRLEVNLVTRQLASLSAISDRFQMPMPPPPDNIFSRLMTGQFSSEILANKHPKQMISKGFNV
jgi:hypothetical protein